MRLLLALLLSTGALLAAPVPKDFRRKVDPLIGTWRLVEARENGGDLPDFAPAVFEITKDEITNRLLVEVGPDFPGGVIWRLPRGSRHPDKVAHLTVEHVGGGRLVLSITTVNLFRYVLVQEVK